MNSRQRILASVAFQPVDRPPYDFFDEAGDLFVDGRYQPGERLRLRYAEQVEARIRFHRKFRTDLIFDAPVLVPSGVPHSVTLAHEGRKISSPETVLSSISGMAWNAMPTPVVGPELLPEQSRGTVIKKVEWANGHSANEALDLATGTTDVLRCAFSSLGDMLTGLDCLAGDLPHADYTFVRQLRSAVGPDVMLSGTLTDPFSAIGWHLGNEALMYAPYDDPKLLRQLSEAVTEIAIATGLDMVRHGLDMIRVGAATCCLLSPELYRQFCLPVHQTLVRAIQAAGGLVHLHLCGRVKHLLPLLAETGAAILETITPPPLGDTTLREAKDVVGKTMCLKGNLLPTGGLLNGEPADCVGEAEACLRAGAPGGGFILSVADNLAPGTPEDNLAAVAELLQGPSFSS